MNLLPTLRACALALACGILHAQAIPVLFSGQIDIVNDGSGTYSIDFGVNDTGPESTIYSLYWDGESVLDNSENLASLESLGPNLWSFSFIHDVVSSTYSLEFSQLLDGGPTSVLSFVLNPPDGNVAINQVSDTYITIANLDPNHTYSADIAATDPFSGTFLINPLSAAAAPELDPRAGYLPLLFVLVSLTALRRRPSIT